MQTIRYYTTKSINDLFKDSMSRIASQAMILTAGVPKLDTSPILHGSTLSSVCSLSVYPNPLLQFNLHLPSYTSSTLHDNGLVAIHVMKPTAKGSNIGRIFAKGVKRNDGKIISKGENKDGEIFHEMTTPFQSIDKKDWEFHEVGNFRLPILNDSERIFICEKNKVFNVENHEIWIVKVVDIISKSTIKTGGLLYFNRRFHHIGHSINE
ncbi:hypothetical protein CLIB1444_01S02916 [[Candida] jaroonii]|uniref:Uncharacterized protein n=1 Tax=[Candida] jaroonii TaxID=467808 RepID=A0ACA9Y086_9ASCO|nr:hypothetical protein CLIB1444_01S02916 [[Candida] jaroonii]